MINLKKDGLAIAALVAAACVSMYADQAQAKSGNSYSMQQQNATDWDNHTIPDPDEDDGSEDDYASTSSTYQSATFKCGTHKVVVPIDGMSMIDNGKMHTIEDLTNTGDRVVGTFRNGTSVVMLIMFSDNKKMQYTNSRMSKNYDCSVDSVTY